MFAAIHTPDFPAQAVLRSRISGNQSSLLTKAAAILDGPSSLPRVFALNEPARQCGISVGMTRLQAEAFPQVELLERSMELEESTQAVLVDCARRFSSMVESTSPGNVILDASGTARLFGPPKLLADTVAKSTRQLGFLANVAVASNPDSAFYAALGFSGVSVIAPGEEADRISSLTLNLLSVPSDMLARFESMGIVTFHDLAVLPSVPVTERFGQTGLAFQDIARGKSHRELVPALQLLEFVETHEFEDPVGDLEPLLFVVNRLLVALIERLEKRALGTNSLDLRLHLTVSHDRDISDTSDLPARASLFERSIRLPVPTQDQKILLKLLQLDLSEHPPGEMVKKVVLEAHPSFLRFTQGGLFDRIAPQPEQLEVLLARIRGIVGENDRQGRSRVGSPTVLDTHSADAFAVETFLPKPRELASTATPRLALRVYRPPLPAQVKMINGRPHTISFASHPARSSRIAAASGPWRTSGGWEQGSQRWERDEWDIAVEDEPMQIFRIYEDSGKQWFVDGMYD